VDGRKRKYAGLQKATICISRRFATTERRTVHLPGFWSVIVDGNLYVRAYNGPESSWYGAAVKQKAGRITAAGMTKEVSFERVADQMNDAIDEAYRAKYSSSPYLKPMIRPHGRSATIRILSRA
jgi:hypothetical protein